MTDLPGFGSFTDPIVGGMGTLIRDAIRSRNYVATVSGWTINKDGTAEFSDIVIRGSGEFGPDPGQHIVLTNAGIIELYNSLNQLVMQLDGQGLVAQNPATGAYIVLNIDGDTFINLQPNDQPGFAYEAAFIVCSSNNVYGDANLLFESPTINGGAKSDIKMYAQNATIPAPTQIDITADQIALVGTTDFYNNSVHPMGRGIVARSYSGSTSAAVTAETVVLTSTQFTFEDNRAYRVQFGPSVVTSNANGRAQFRIRKDNAAGMILGGGRIIQGSASAANIVQAEATHYFRNDTGAPITCYIALTLQNLDGGANTAAQSIGETGLNRWLLVEDCGGSTGYDWATALI